ncbi:MAG: hypothetical protein HW378_3630 [Anaerolineales bacterium]|nr:hypothetical protein [Anaerolineales bacterium]
MPDNYTDLRIRVRAWEEAYYPVEAELDDGSRFEGGELRLDQQALLASELDPKAYGQLLFNALFAGDIRRAYDKATARADALTEGRLRVQLWVDTEATELHAIPWERLYHLSRGHAVPLTTSTQTPFSRYTSLETPEPPPVTERPIKMLAAISNPLNLPGGLAPANSEVEIENLRRGLGDLRKTNTVQVTILPGRSGLSPELRSQLEAEGYQIAEGNTTLDNLLRYMPGMHVFHFVGHGAFRRQTEHGPGQAVLYLEKDDGAWQVAKDDDIVARLAALGDLPHLVFLVACESAVRDAKAEHPFIGLGPKLVQAGFPAVVAMQAQVPVETARILTGEFYRRLVEHGEVDQALSQARLLMFKPDRTDWAIPVLFMRLRRGKLFAPHSAIPEVEKRSFEAAMPQTITVGQETEIRVMIASPGSLGLRAHLPDNTKVGDLIAQTDVEKNEVPVEFLRDPSTNEPLPIDLFVHITASSFSIEQPTKKLQVPPGQDSGIATFFLMPQTNQKLARIRIELFQDERLEDLIGSISLTREVKDWKNEIVEKVFLLVTFPVNLAFNVGQQAKERKMSDDKSNQSGGVNISGRNVTVGGDVVGRDKITTTTTYGPGVSPDKLVELLKEFASIKRQIGTLDLEDDDKDDLKTNVQRIEDEVKKGDHADTSKVEKAMKKIAGMSDDILKVVVASLTNPVAGVAEAIRLIAQKAKESR